MKLSKEFILIERLTLMLTGQTLCHLCPCLPVRQSHPFNSRSKTLGNVNGSFVSLFTVHRILLFWIMKEFRIKSQENFRVYHSFGEHYIFMVRWTHVPECKVNVKAPEKEQGPEGRLWLKEHEKEQTTSIT